MIEKKRYARIEECPDGSGDSILIFPDDFAKEFGLLSGQIVDLNVENGVLTIRKNYEHYKT